MAVELSANQREVIDKLKNGSILCADTGLGKTRTALAYYSKVAKAKPLYIITTARKRDTNDWEKEAEPFGFKKKIFIDSWNNIKKYVNVSNAFFIFDEQRVVGYGVWTKSFLKITSKNAWILLTATPGDKWSDYMPVFIANGYYKNKSDFERKHAIYSRFTTYPKITGYRDEGRLLRIKKDILVTMTNDKKTTQHHMDILVDYDKILYKTVVKNRWNYEKEKPIENPSELFVLMRKITNSDPSRINAIRDLLKMHKKVIVFYSFDYELDILMNADYGKRIKIAQWNGHTHELIPKTDSWIYLVQYTAGAEGWNCIETDTIIFYSQSYSYKAMVQAAGRIDRRNTKFSDLYYYHLVSRSSIDNAIQIALRQKKDFNENNFIF